MEKQKYLYLALCLLGLSQLTFGEPVIENGEGEKSIVVGEENEAKGTQSTAVGTYNKVKGEFATAVGLANTVEGSWGSAVGNYNKVEGAQSAVVGERNEVNGYQSTAVGRYNEVKGKFATAVGLANTVEGNWGSAVGNYNKVEGAQSVVVGERNEVKGAQSAVVGRYNEVKGKFATAVGVDNVITGSNSSTFGYRNLVTGKGSGVWGAEFNKNKGDASYMIGNKNKIAAGTSDNFILGNSVSIGEGINNSVALGTDSTVSASNEVSVGSAGKERKITNVADGTLSPTSTDAVNGSQLYEISQKIEGQGLDELKKDLKQDYKKVKNEMRGIASLSAALAGLHPMQYDPYAPSQIMAAVGSYREKQAIAVGLSHYFTSHVMMSAGVALSDEKRTSIMANLGVTWKFGKGGSQASVENPQIMQSEMQRLARENQAFQAKIGSLESKVQELETALQSLLKK